MLILRIIITLQLVTVARATRSLASHRVGRGIAQGRGSERSERTLNKVYIIQMYYSALTACASGWPRPPENDSQ